MAIAVDFESYYDNELSITKMGTDAYIAHPDVDIYLVTVVGKGISYSGPVEGAPWEEISGEEFVSHNARFDETVFPEAVSRGQIPADTTYTAWHCTADLAVYLGAPRNLKGACEVLLDREVSKEYRVVAKGKHGKDFSEEEMKIVIAAGFGDAEGCLELWEKYNHVWPENEREISKQNRELTRIGCAVDVEKLDAAISSLSTKVWEYEQKIPWDWSGNKTPLSPKKIAAECRKVEIPCPSSFAKDSLECQEWEEQYAETYPWISVLRSWRKGYALLGKLKRIRERIRKDPITGEENNFPYSIKYFGAHTGRFSGDNGFNMLNIYSKELEGINVRSMFIPRKGKKLLIVDYRQIEPRILSWFARDTAALKELQAGTSVYEVHARQTMGYANDEPMKTADPQGYKLAKARILGLGYGCGAKTFVNVAKNLAGLVLTLEEAQQTVWDYRNSNPAILRFWNRLDSLLRAALRSKSRKLSLKLPSGRSMNYYNVASPDRGISVQAGLAAHRTFTWGGKLTENVVQATAREVFMDGWLQVMEAFQDPEELRLLFHVYDEFVFEVDPDIDVAKVEEILCQPPKWGTTIPLDVESELVDHYKK